ncbi:MAG: hypothetical protein IJK01_05205 [Clostridia bacterium]|jgi:uncharacterized membrane protein HdeD (DUF308 family)|nr:hypothetical protein [Clostridia bacterium]
MTAWQRIRNILWGLLLIASGLLLILLPETGTGIVILILAGSLLLSGLRMLLYYCTMARHMVSGRASLILAVLIIDFGLFTLTLYDAPQLYIILYLVGAHLFTGGVDLARAVDAMKNDSPLWKRSIALGVINLLFAVAAPVFALVLHSEQLLLVVFAASLFYDAAESFFSAFQRATVLSIP